MPYSISMVRVDAFRSRSRFDALSILPVPVSWQVNVISTTRRDRYLGDSVACLEESRTEELLR